MQEFLTVNEAAKLVGITREACNQAILRGDIEARRFGRAWQVLRVSAERYAETRRGAKKQRQ